MTQLDLFPNLLDNKCQFDCYCYDSLDNHCCYNYERPLKCKYNIDKVICNSSVAKVNRLVLELQRLTGKKIRFEDE